MLIRRDVKTVRDLVKEAGIAYKGQDYIRYVQNDEIKSITFDGFDSFCKPIMAWVAEQSNLFGHPVRVAMMGPNTPLYFLMFTGVICGGGISIPMDPQMPQDTVCNCLKKAEADFLICAPSINIDEEKILANCPGLSEILKMSEGEYPCCTSIIDIYRGRVETIKVSEKDCAAIIFTSGTTGEEKGVMLSNGNLVDNIFSSACDMNAAKVNMLPIHHAFCINADVLNPFLTASSMVLNGDTSKLAENIIRFNPTSISMVPMVAQALYNKLLLISKQTGKTPYELRTKVFGTKLTKIVAGGAHLPAELVEKYQEIGIFLCQGYGMSECSPVISSPDYTRPDKAHTAGRVVPGCQTRVIDGELQVKSPSVMMGYVNAPKLTAEVITEDGWLRTGDIGMEDDEGFLHITGRKKNLIILSNGANVSPEQIENLILDHELIQETLVYGEGNNIVAEVYTDSKYVALNGITNIKEAVESIIAEVNAPLPSYKKIMKLVIRTIPFERTGSNKIKRNQRAPKDAILSEDAPKTRMPENEVQKKIYKCLSEILNHENFGIDTNLFTVGLDSLGCVMALTAFSENLDFFIEFDDIMTNNTVEKLEKLYNEKSAGLDIDFSPRPVYPLTKVQMYFAYVIKGNTTANIPSLFKLHDSVDLGKMKDAINKLFKIHPILNAVVQMFENKGYACFRNDSREINIPTITLAPDQWEDKKKNLIRPYMYTENEPLYHIEFYIVDDARYLFIDIAHIISDGVSLSVIIDDLNKLYCGLPVKERKFSFYDFVVDNQYRTDNGLNTPNVEYFMNLMSGMKIKRTILNRKDKQNLEIGENAVIRNTFNTDYKKITHFCNRQGISENALFLTAFNTCISIFSDRDDTISTSIHSGRIDSRWANIIGCLFTTYNFRYKFNRKEKISNALENSAKQIMDTMCCRLNNLHADEMFFQYQGTLLNFPEIGGAPAKREHLQLDSLPFHLMVFSNEKEYNYELRYWENRFEEKQLLIFMEIMDAVLSAMLEKDIVGDIYKQIPKSLFPEKVTVSAEALNIEASCELVKGKDTVEISIINRNGYQQPIGGWGTLCINSNPTNRVARIMVDGTVDFLENSGRSVMFENLTGRSFPDLAKLESVIKNFNDVEHAEAYISYSSDNELHLTAKVDGTVNGEELMEYLNQNCEKHMIPSILIINGKFFNG